MIERVLVLGLVLGLTAVALYLWRRRDGRFAQADDGGFFHRSDLGMADGERPEVVLVEFGTEHCAPCRRVEQHLDTLAGDVPGLRVVTVDAGQRLDLADRYRVRRVPTVFVADGDLRILHRASGAITEDGLRERLPDVAARSIG